MTVAELIEALRIMPQDAVVVVPGMMGGIDDYIEGLVTADSMKSYGAKLYDSVDGLRWVDSSYRCYSEIPEPEQTVCAIS